MSGEDGGGNGPANQGQPSGVNATLFTQDQVNYFAAQEKRGALDGYFKGLGFDSTPSPDDLKQVLTDAGEYKKLKDGEKGEVQRLNDGLSEANKKAERVPVLEADLLRAQIAADAGLKSRYWKYVEGKSEDEIKASVQDVLKDIRADGDDEGDDGDKQDQSGTGGKPPDPNPQQGRGGGKPPGQSLQSGAAAYAAKHKKE